MPERGRAGLKITLPAQGRRRGLKFCWRTTGSGDLRRRYRARVQTSASRGRLQSRLQSEFIVPQPAPPVQRKETIGAMRVANVGIAACGKFIRNLLNLPFAEPGSRLESRSLLLTVDVCRRQAACERISSSVAVTSHRHHERIDNVSETPRSVHGRLVGCGRTPPPQAVFHVCGSPRA